MRRLPMFSARSCSRALLRLPGVGRPILQMGKVADMTLKPGYDQATRQKDTGHESLEFLQHVSLLPLVTVSSRKGGLCSAARILRFKLLLVAATLFAVPPTVASSAVDQPADAVIRALADQTAAQLVRNELEAVYSAMSPKLKAAYSHDELVKPVGSMQNFFGHIASYDFETINYGKRGVGGEWIRIATYWYHAKTDKYPDNTYLKVEITQEQGRYYVAGYSMERVLLGGKLPFLKH